MSKAKSTSLSSVPGLMDPVAFALSTLTLEEKEGRPEGKEVVKTMPPTILPLSMVSVAKSVFTPGKTYRIRTIRIATLVSSGAGTMNLATQISPSNMSQFSALSALFGECRLHSTRVHIVMRTPVGGPVPLAVAFNPTAIAGFSPPSSTFVCELPGAKILNTWNTVSSPRLTWSSKQTRPWSVTTSTSTATDPVGGIAGAWCYSLVAAVSGAVNIADYLIECDYEFRNPQ